MKILSVDDSRSLRQFIKDTIDILGFDFFEAENGQQGLEVLEQVKDIDLILLDWNMPVMDGFEMLKAVKADDRFKHIPVTMVTTEIEREKVILSIQTGAKNYVMKPFTQEELIAKIMESLGMGGI